VDGAAPPAAAFRCSPWRLVDDRPQVEKSIELVRERIAEGAYFQVNLTSRLRAELAGDASALFEALRLAQPDGYCLALDGGGWQVLSVSPELFFDWTPGGILTTRPMKGTAPRHPDPEADAAAAEVLRGSAKERAENMMIVDLMRNDVSRLAIAGTVRVPRLFDLEPLPTAWQMTSTVECDTRPEVGLADVFGALFPCGSVTGAPKIAAMKAIAELETQPRGAYCGAIGVVRPGGHATFNVGIRTVVVTGGQAECGVGSGITHLSTSSGEYDEWIVKRRFLMRASASFALLETMRLEDGRYELRARHLARLARSALHFGFPWEPAGVAAALDQLAAEHSRGIWRVRLTLDRTGSVATEYMALEGTPGLVRVALAPAPIESGDEFLLHKTTRREIYERFAPGPETFDTLLWNERGEATEFTRGNLVVELDGERITPPVACGLLPGVYREELLVRGDVREAVVPVAALGRATGLWFVNSVRGMIPADLA
jgi:para-aminobenzoate synthetase / 4-amino-4-deoxychorismate lyase